MPDLDIQVALPGALVRSYRFSETPVLVGRSDDCHLIVRHAAMPRELCRLWIDEERSRVLVEERPGLTNPLLLDGRPVSGGAAGSRLELSVGPVGLIAAPARYDETPRPTRRRRSLLAGLGIGLALLGLTLSLGSSGQAKGASTTPALPPRPFPAEVGADDVIGKREDPARAALHRSRADEIMSRPDAGPAEQVEALLALRRAAALLPRRQAEDIARRARELEDLLLATYREQSLALERALERRDGRAASQAARALLAHLAHHDDNETRERLSAIAGNNH